MGHSQRIINIAISNLKGVEKTAFVLKARCLNILIKRNSQLPLPVVCNLSLSAEACPPDLEGAGRSSCPPQSVTSRE